MVSSKKISRLLELVKPTVFTHDDIKTHEEILKRWKELGLVGEKYKIIVNPEYYGTIQLIDDPNETHKMKDLKTLLEEQE